MAGGPRKSKKSAKRRGAAPAPAPSAAAPRPHRPVLGNDPFTRGAAGRGAEDATSPSPQPSPPLRGGEGELTARPTATPRPPRTTPSPPLRGGEGQGEGQTSPAGFATERLAAAATRVAEVERKVDSALDGVEKRLHDLAAAAGLANAREDLGHALAQLLPALRGRLSAALDLVRLIEPPERLDRFGMDPRFAERAAPLLEFLYSTWWRVEVRGIERVPATGPAIVVANHAGVVPWDAFVLRHALARDHAARRELRPLLDDRECETPFVGPAAVRLGAVRASPEAAERILRGGGVLAVFPEGSAGARKPWRERYDLQRFGRGGFVKIALRTGAPIVPCAIVGSEEASPGISRTGWLAERLGVPILSANPILRFGPAALVPLPSKWTLRFADPVDVRGHGAAGAEDPALVNELAERVRATLQGMLDEGVAARSSVFL